MTGALPPLWARSSTIPTRTLARHSTALAPISVWNRRRRAFARPTRACSGPSVNPRLSAFRRSAVEQPPDQAHDRDHDQQDQDPGWAAQCGAASAATEAHHGAIVGRRPEPVQGSRSRAYTPVAALTPVRFV